MMKKFILVIITVLSFSAFASAQNDTAVWKGKPQKSKEWNPNGGTKENDVWNGGDDKNNHKKHQGKANKKNKQWKNDNGQGNDDWKDKDDDSKDKNHKNTKEGKKDKKWKDDNGQGNDDWKDKDDDSKQKNNKNNGGKDGHKKGNSKNRKVENISKPSVPTIAPINN